MTGQVYVVLLPLAADVTAPQNPLWVTVLIGIAGGVGTIVASWIARQATLRAAQATAATERDANLARLAVDREDELVRLGLQQIGSSDETTRNVGYDLLTVMVTYPGLSRENAHVIVEVTRRHNEAILGQATAAADKGEPVDFVQVG